MTITKAEVFRALHTGPSPLVLANAWDVASARIAESVGAQAVATTSAGVAWSLGAPDGDQLSPDRAIDLIARIAAIVDVPVSADIEGGYADTPEGVADTVQRVIAAGAVGVNIEDGRCGPEALADRIAAARAVDPNLFINARIDTFLFGLGEPETRLAETLKRAAAYRAAGADGVFVPGVVEPEVVAELVAGIDGPLNVLAGPGAPSVGELGKLGVARVSVGSSISQRAYQVMRQAARELFDSGTYDALADPMDYGELNGLLSKRDNG